MRNGMLFLLLMLLLVSCSKSVNSRSQFAELTIDGNRFVFDSLVAVLDTSDQGITSHFQLYDRATHSYIVWELRTGSKRINGAYAYPGERYPGPSISFCQLQTYVDNVPGTYELQRSPFSISIDEWENDRIRGKLSGKLTCLTCTPFGTDLPLSNAEFELPCSYQ